MGDLLDRALAESELDRDRLAHLVLDAEATARSARVGGLTAGEAELLADTPAVPADEVAERALAGQLAARAYLREHSVPLAEAARRLSLVRSGLQHRISRGTLYAFDLGDGRRVPTWQFTADGLLPHLGAVLAALRPDARPLELARLMTVRHDELRGETIPAWLAQGGPVDPVLAVIERARHA